MTDQAKHELSSPSPSTGAPGEQEIEQLLASIGRDYNAPLVERIRWLVLDYEKRGDLLMAATAKLKSGAPGEWKGIELIAAERKRQVDVEGWTSGEMAAAAIAYVLAAHPHEDRDESLERGFWPWDEAWWKPSNDPVRNLVKAGALIAAEIDRLQRASPPLLTEGETPQRDEQE